MDNLSDDFVDRTEEVNNFRGLIKDQRHRLLLIYGREGRGKSYLVRQLLRISNTEQMVSVMVDFGRLGMLTEPEEVINHLSERLGSIFIARMAQAEAEIPSQLASDLAEIEKMLSRALTASPQGQGQGVSLENIEKVEVGGDVVGGSKISIQVGPPQLNPSGGKAQKQVANEWRRIFVFRTALKTFLAEQKRVILFFDHFERATTPVSRWVSEHMLNLILEASGGFSNLWIVVSGQKVPLQEEIYQLQDILRSQRINSLPDDAVYLFWVERRGVPKAKVNEYIEDAKGNTKILFINLYEHLEGEAK